MWVELPVGVDDDDAENDAQEGEVNAHLSDGASSPDCHSVSLFDPGVYDKVPGRGEDV